MPSETHQNELKAHVFLKTLVLKCSSARQASLNRPLSPLTQPGFTLLGRAKRTLRRKLHLVGRLDRSVSGLSLLAFDPETAEAG